MARWIDSVSVAFNDNDGDAGWRVNPESAKDLIRHWRIFGVWRTRWILFKRFWRALYWLEIYAGNCGVPRKGRRKWIFKSSIPE
jgi:transposase